MILYKKSQHYVTVIDLINDCEVEDIFMNNFVN